MINFRSFNRCCLTTLLCLALAAASQPASAECEDFLDVDFHQGMQEYYWKWDTKLDQLFEIKPSEAQGLEAF